MRTEQDSLDSLNYLFKLTRCESEEEGQAVRLEAEAKKKEALKRIKKLQPGLKRGEDKQLEKERKKKECYALYDKMMKEEHWLKSEPKIKTEIAKKMHCTVKTITRYMQERTE